VDIFLLSVGIHFFYALLAADSGLFITAEWRTEKMLARLIDPYKAGFDCGSGPMRFGQVIGPDRAG
jgi:hypothetical protein